MGKNLIQLKFEKIKGREIPSFPGCFLPKSTKKIKYYHMEQLFLLDNIAKIKLCLGRKRVYTGDKGANGTTWIKKFLLRNTTHMIN